MARASSDTAPIVPARRCSTSVPRAQPDLGPHAYLTGGDLHDGQKCDTRTTTRPPLRQSTHGATSIASPSWSARITPCPTHPLASPQHHRVSSQASVPQRAFSARPPVHSLEPAALCAWQPTPLPTPSGGCRRHSRHSKHPDAPDNTRRPAHRQSQPRRPAGCRGAARAAGRGEASASRRVTARRWSYANRLPERGQSTHRRHVVGPPRGVFAVFLKKRDFPRGRYRGSPATRSGALGIGGNRGGARRSRLGDASAHETA